MTCIIAFKDTMNNVFLIGDKCGSNGNTKDICVEPKVFHKNGFMIGYTTSFYMGQLLKHVWEVPEKNDSEGVDYYLHNTIRKSLINMFKINNFGEHENGYNIGDFILIYDSRIFTVYADMQIFEHKYLSSVGCGDVAARAAIEAYLNSGVSIQPEDMLTSTMEIVSNICCGVSKDYDIIDNKTNKELLE